jgi:hypothetical protein
MQMSIFCISRVSTVLRFIITVVPEADQKICEY